MRRKTGVVAALLVLAVVVGAIVSANYLGLILPPEDTTRFVPAGVDSAVRVNTTALGDDTVTDELLRTTLGRGYDEVIGAVGNRTGTDPEALREATVFVGDPAADAAASRGPGGARYVGVVFRTEPLDDPADGLDGFDAEETSYNGVPLYTVRPNATEAARPFYATAVGRGVYVVGTEGAVRDASDVAWRNAEALDAASRDELTAAPATFVSTDPPLADVSSVTGAYTTRPGVVALDIELRPSDTADVGDVRRTVGTYATAARLLDDEHLDTVLGATEVRETNSSVVVEYRGSVDVTASAFRVLDPRLGWTDGIKEFLEGLGITGFSTPEEDDTANTTG
jgi:hypothetical protein